MPAHFAPGECRHKYKVGGSYPSWEGHRLADEAFVVATASQVGIYTVVRPASGKLKGTPDLLQVVDFRPIAPAPSFARVLLFPSDKDP